MATKRHDEQQFQGGAKHLAGSFCQAAVATGVAAAGTTIADATQLTSGVNVVSTVGAGQGVKLPAAAVGAEIVVQNLGANNLEVYPPNGSSTINGAAAGGAITLAAATDDVGRFTKTGANSWLATVSAGPST